MRIRIESRIWDRIVRTLMAVDRNARFEGTERGEVKVTACAEDLSQCTVEIQKGWTESANIESSGEDPSFVLDLQQVKDALQNVKIGRMDIIELVSKPREPIVDFVGQKDKRAAVPKIEGDIPKGLPPGFLEELPLVKFRIGGPKVKRVFNEIFNTDDTINITLGSYKVRAEIGLEGPIDVEGKGVCFWKSGDADEIFISNEPVSPFPEIEGFTTRYYVEPAVKAMSEISKKENVEVSFGPKSPIGIKFRLAETIFVEYRQVAKLEGNL